MNRERENGEPKSGDHFIGDTVHEAAQKAKEKYPNSVFHFVRVGHPAVYQFTSTPTIPSFKL